MKRSAILVCTLLLAGLTSPSAGGGPSPWPSEEDVSRFGFAVWPEDSVEEAQQACAEHADDQPWRLSPTKTALRFARVKLDHDKPDVDEGMSEVGTDEARLWLYAREVFLSNIFELRRYDVCWYITRVDEREDSVGAVVAFSRNRGSRWVYLERWRGSTGFDEIGFAEFEKSWGPSDDPRRRAWDMPDEADQEGHVLITNWDDRGKVQGATGVYARPHPPPPEIGGGERVFPLGERYSWDSIPKDDRRRACRLSTSTNREPRRVLNELLQWEFGNAMPSGPYPDVMRTGPHGWIGDRVRVDRIATGKWRVKIDDVRYLFLVVKVTDDCWALEKIRPLDKKRPLQEAFLDDNAVTMDFRWGAATKTETTLGYGSDLHGGFVHSYVNSPVTFYRRFYDGEQYDPGVPLAGRVMVISYKQGRYVNAFARRLPPRAPSAK